MRRKTRRRKQRSCWEIACWHARQARRQGMNPVLVALVFLAALLSIMPPLSFPTTAPQRRRSCSGEDWPVTDYERGYPGPELKRKGHKGDRYGARPSMRRLMRDLRRPASRADAEQALLGRLSDADLRIWVSERIANDQINRLSIFVRPGSPDEAVIAGWRSELTADQAAEDEAAEEAHVQLEMLRTLAALAGKGSTAMPGTLKG